MTAFTRKLTAEDRVEIRLMAKEGISLRKIATKFGVDRSSIRYHLKKSGDYIQKSITGPPVFRRKPDVIPEGFCKLCGAIPICQSIPELREQGICDICGGITYNNH